MYRAIEAIYENGKLKFLENIGNIKKARVMVVFLDKKEDEELKRGNIAELPSIEFTKEAIGKFNRQFEGVEKRMENDDVDLLNDAFFSLEPIDMGYTSANMLDSIIANNGITERE